MGELYAGIQTHTPESKAAGLRRLIVGTQMDARNNQLNLQLRVPSSFSSSNKPFDVQMRSYLATLFANAAGMSANSSHISSSLRKYCCSLYFLGRRGSARVKPS
jgi:hypothetical protein